LEIEGKQRSPLNDDGITHDTHQGQYSTMGKMNQSLKVHVDLLDISKDVQADSDARKMIDLVKNEILASPSQAGTLLRRERPSQEEIGLVQKQVFRFIQPKDKYTALASMLLKSQAFHITYKSTPEERVTVTDLPRTKFKKPYIPVRDYDSSKMATKEEDLHPLSVSHQFPFAGLAKLDTSSLVSEDPRPHVGMDIVSFDAHNPKLYSDEREFINVFQGSFTAWEWSRIENEHSFRLNEYYVRWAMKEAYTKALGLGMGIDFTSFEMKLTPPDQESYDSCLWRYISSQRDGCNLSGSICYLKSQKTEPWQFCFQPLYDQTLGGTQRQSSDAKGCICICVGPFPGESKPSSRFHTAVHWTNLQSLVRWHQPNSTALLESNTCSLS
jgi:phosphopantetheinyl transferase (holo-ACP synthase)